MKYTNLGSTGLNVSVLGMGTGGPSRAGKRTGKSKSESVDIIRTGLDSGINFIDSAEAYGTEDIVGEAVSGLNRDSVIISTKTHAWQEPETGSIFPRLEQSLRNLSTDYIDIYLLHAVTHDLYSETAEHFIPQLEKARDQGKIRFIGISEMFMSDPSHEMLAAALDDQIWEVFMVGFNFLNQSARVKLLEKTEKKGIGTLDMFAVRRALSDASRRKEVVRELLDSGQLNSEDIPEPESQDPLRFLLEESDAETFPEMAYRYCLEEPGIHVVLTGTGSREHLLQNIKSAEKPALSPHLKEKIDGIFGRVNSVSGH
ncbi:MAG: aldo/keto reductase [Spirochaetia bacterium]